MPSTYSTNLALELIGTGDQAGVWGNTTNTNLGTLIEQAISGYVTQAVATGTDTTITIPNGATGVARNMYIELTGTGGTNTNLIVPSNKKLYFIFNNSTGAVTVKVSGQTGVSVPQGKKVVLVSNGTDIVNGINYIADFGTNSFTVTNLTATSATITTLTGTSAGITTISSGSANITQLQSTSATITTLTGTSANIATLSGTTATFTSATVTNLALTSVTLSNLNIASANITTLTSSSATISTTLALSGGTANGVLYLNGSKVATSGTALVFDGTNFGLGTNTLTYTFNVAAPTARANYTSTTGTNTVWQNHANTGGNFYIGIENSAGTAFGTTAYSSVLWSTGSTPIVFATSGAEQMRLTSTGLGIGTSSPTHKLQTNGSGRFGTMTTGPGLLSGSSDTFQVGLNQDNTNTTNTQVWAEYVNGATSASWAVRYRAANDTGTASTRLFLDAASGNLGIGTSSPDNKLEVTVGDNAGINIEQSGTAQTGYLNFRDSDGALQGRISYDHANDSLRFATNNSEKFRITSGGDVGIGTSSPSAKLDVRGGVLIAAATPQIQFTDTDNNADAYIQGTDGNLRFFADDNSEAASSFIGWYIDGSQKMYLDSSGNLGLGVTPSAWGNNGKPLQAANASFWGLSGTATFSSVGANYFYDGSYKYISTAAASDYYQLSGAHVWRTAASGTAGNAITFTQAMTLDASGNLGVGTTSQNERIRINSSTAGEARMTIAYNGTVITYFGSYSGIVGSGNADDTFLTSVGAKNLIFGTNSTERARITSGGYSKFSNAGTYQGSTGSYHELRQSADETIAFVTNTANSLDGTVRGIRVLYNNATPNNTSNNFLYCDDSTQLRASIRSNGGLANYQSNNVDLSDARTKKDIAPAASMWGKIGALEIVTYKYNDQTHDDVNVGVIAQQVESVEPVWVDADGFGETPEGEEPLKTVYTKDITFAAIKALQEAMARIEKLEAEMAALKGA